MFRGCTTSKTSPEAYYTGKIGQLFRSIVLMDLYEYCATTIVTRYGVRLFGSRNVLKTYGLRYLC